MCSTKQAYMPYLGKDFGMEKWLHLVHVEAKDRATIRLRGREQEHRKAMRDKRGTEAIARAAGGSSPEGVLIRRLTIVSSYGPPELMRWYKRVRH